MNIIIIAGMNEGKLLSKIEPLLQNDRVERVFLIRRTPVTGYEKLISVSPPVWMRKIIPMAEVWRMLAAIKLAFSNNVRLIVGIHYQMHCIYAAIAGMLAGKKFVFLIIENPELYAGSRLFKMLCRKAFKIGVRGSHSKACLTALEVNQDRIFAPPNLFDFDKMPVTPLDKEYDVLFIGSFVTAKRVDILLKAIQLLKNKMPELRALLIGEGRLKKDMVLLSKQLEVFSCITFKDYERNVHLPIRQSKILMLTSGSEGLPMVLIEALACGVPCIVPDVGDITDVAIDGYNSVVVEPLNPKAFADAAHRLLTDEDFYSRLSENALKLRADKAHEYSMENLKNIWLPILE